MSASREPPAEATTESKERVNVVPTGTGITREYQRLESALATPASFESFDRSAYSEAALARAADFWSARMAAEHRSVQVFTQIALQLIEANAPHDAKTIMLRMAQDELLHTALCARVLESLEAPPSCEVDIRVAPLATHRGCSLDERALRNVAYATCLSEMVAVARLTDSLETTQDPAMRSAVRSVLADEVMHGQFGFLYLDSLAEHPDQMSLKEDLGDYLVHAFAVLEEELAPAVAREVSCPDAETMALGVIDPVRAHAAFFATVEHAIVPGLEARGVAAARAWRNRRKVTPL